MADYQSLIETKLEPLGRSNNDIIYRCPQCEGDKGSGHLYVDYNRNYWHCFKCNAGSKRLEGLLRLLHIDIAYDYEKLYNEYDKSLDDIISIRRKDPELKLVDYSNDLNTLTEYYKLHTKELSQQAFDYLLRRGLTPDMMMKLGIKEGVSRFGENFNINGRNYIGRDYSGRIMVPSRRKDGSISFYVGRDYIGDKDAKYLNAPKELASASEDVWNLDMVDSDSVIICEGVFTAIASAPIKMNAVATYGKSIAQRSSTEGVKVTSQGEKLLAKNFKNYFVAYDADAHTEAIKSCNYLYDRGANVYLIIIDPEKYGSHADIADIGYEEFKKLLINSIHYTGGLSLL